MTSELVLDSLERIMRSAVGLTAMSIGATAPASDLTIAQWRALAVVAAGPAPVRVGEVAARLGRSLPSASRFLRRLERHGLVVTERDEADRRVTLVHVSAAGADLWEAVVNQRRAALTSVLEPHGALPVDLASGLRLIADALDGLA